MDDVNVISIPCFYGNCLEEQNPMPQPVYRTAADVMFGNQRVGRYFVPVEVIPKRFVCYLIAEPPIAKLKEKILQV